MNENATLRSTARSLLSGRRLALLAGVAGLGAAAIVGPDLSLRATVPTFTSGAYAQAVMRPSSFADIVEKVKPAVFAVRVKVENAASMMNFEGESPFERGDNSPMERFFKRFGFGDMPEGMRPENRRGPGMRQFSMAQGSGFFISADGYAVTNNHVVSRGQTVEVRTDDGKTYEAKVIGSDPRTDLALLKVDGRNDFPYVRFAEKGPRVGDWVLAVGNPFGLGGTVTAGIISGNGRDIGAGPYDDFIQIDAPVNKGNSGGPAFDVDGNVIGVNTAIFSPSGGNVGIAFAIPAPAVQNVVAQLKENGSVSRGWIGVHIQPVTADIADSLGLKIAEGALVAEAQANSPAAKADIKAGDVIVSVDGDRIKDARELARKIGAIAPGKDVKLGVMRDGSERTVSVSLGELPNERQARTGGSDTRRDRGADVPRLGLMLAPAGDGGEGVRVTGVESDGPAAQRGLQTGDIILDVAGKTVSTPADVRRAVADARADGKKTVLFRVKSENVTKFVALPVVRG